MLEEQDIFVDFFAGSASSFDAIARLNVRNGIVRRAVLVQLPEAVAAGSEAAKDGYSTIADIARDRMRRVIARERDAQDLASPVTSVVGFKSFLLTPSNFKQWRGDGIDTPEQLAEQIQLFAQSEKDGAQVEDMLYELLLKFGQELATPIETLEFALSPSPLAPLPEGEGNSGRVFAIHGRKMLFVLDRFSEAMIQPLLDLQPCEIIAIDGVFHDSDTLKTNLDLQCRDAGIKFTCL